ncbi:MAG TPA: hypothetical protein VEB39_00130 [Sphingomicrobium sp.]|nr:hypothetical protein [Sphingomicrobium sp.]
MTDDQLWRSRFLAFTLVRLAGLLLFLAGIVIAFSDLVRPGGWPLLGGLMAIAGAIDAVLAPRILRRAWERQDSGQ